MPFVLDASCTLAWLLPNQHTPAADQVLEAVMRDYAICPAIWHFEVASVIARAVAAADLTRAAAEMFLNDVSTLDMRIVTETGSLVDLVKLAEEFQLTGYDAAYLALSLERSLPLATFDEKLQRAAQAAGVKLLAGR